MFFYYKKNFSNSSNTVVKTNATKVHLCFYINCVKDADTLELFKMVDNACYKNKGDVTDKIDKLCKFLFERNKEELIPLLEENTIGHELNSLLNKCTEDV